jgi:hypothetical protein
LRSSPRRSNTRALGATDIGTENKYPPSPVSPTLREGIFGQRGSDVSMNTSSGSTALSPSNLSRIRKGAQNQCWPTFFTRTRTKMKRSSFRGIRPTSATASRSVAAATSSVNGPHVTGVACWFCSTSNARTIPIIAVSEWADVRSAMRSDPRRRLPAAVGGPRTATSLRLT